jgi:hypothetical protein
MGSLAVETEGTQSPHIHLEAVRARFEREFGASF